MMKRFKSLFSIVFLFCAAAAFSENRLHTVMLIDNPNSSLRGADISAQCDANAQVLQSIVENALQQWPNSFTITRIDGDNANPDTIRNFFQNSQVDPADTFFFYYCGHGGFDRQQGQFFAMGRGDILRSEIKQHMTAKGTKAVIMITDSCSNYSVVGLAPKAPGPDYSAFVDLFFNTRDVVDLTAASGGEYAWFTEGGGVFSEAVMNTIVLGKEQLDQDRDGRVTWREIFPMIKDETARNFTDGRQRAAADAPIKTARSQTPWAYSLGQ